MSNDIDELLIAVQLCDSGFGGSLNHSMGLEAAISFKFIEKSSNGIKQYLNLLIEQCIYLHFLIIRSTYDLDINSTDFISNFLSINQLTHATINNIVSRRASINQGKCFFKMVYETFNIKFINISKLFHIINESNKSSTIDSNNHIHTHYNCIFGIICKLLNLSIQRTYQIFLRILIRDVINSSIRLNVLGPLEGARIQLDMSYLIDNIVKEEILKDMSCNNDKYIPKQISPHLEFIQSTHDMLYSRLFNS